MAENKKSFLLYCDLIHTVDQMPNELAGELFKHILSYVNDKNPTSENLIINLTFEPIKQSLKRDLVKYENIVEQKRQAGLASAESRKQKQQVSTRVESVEHSSTKSTDSVSDSVSVINKDLLVFDNFRKEYLGTKLGNETEFKNFQKHTDWKNVLPTLQNILKLQIENRNAKKQRSEFVPEWKNLKTWINQRCWEEVIEENKEFKPKYPRPDLSGLL